jgi:TolB protein
MKFRNAFMLALLAGEVFGPPVFAQDRLFVDITEGAAAPVVIGVPDIVSGFSSDLVEGPDVGIALAEILRADLGTSPLFKVVPSQPRAEAGDRDILREFAARGTQGLVIGRATRTGEGVFSYSCVYYDVFGEAAEVSRDFDVPLREWRRAAHKCADMVFSHVTGYLGHFDTRFVTVSAGPGGAQGADKKARVIAIDFDGANPQELTSRDRLVAMPRVSRDHRLLLFMAFDNEVPGLEFVDLATGQGGRLQLPPGLPSAATFSPDGQRAALALSINGNTDIYEYEFATGKAVRLTDTTGIDTHPSYSPDGESIAFESDRSGQQQIYVMSRDGSSQRRISFDAAHAAPAWSPDGELIAFSSPTSNGSEVGVMAPDGTKRRLLTEGPHDEDPSWAPSGRAIAFQRLSSDDGQPELRIVDLSGRRQHSVNLPMTASQPNWSEVRP